MLRSPDHPGLFIRQVRPLVNQGAESAYFLSHDVLSKVILIPCGYIPQILAPDLVVGSALEIEACVPPRGQKRDFGCTPEWSSSPNSEGNAKPDPDEYDTNVDGAIKSNVNLGFGSKTVGPSSPPRVKNSISDWDVFGLASPILGKRSRTEMESPLFKPVLAPSPPPSLFSQTDEGDSVHGGGTRSIFQGHVRVADSLRTPSRYPRTSSRSEPKRSFPPLSPSRLPSVAVMMGAVDTTDGMNARSSGRGVGGLRKVSREEQRVEFRLSPADVQSHLDGDERVKRHEPPGAATVEASDMNYLSPGSFPSDSGIRSCSPTASSMSPRTEVLFGSDVSETHRDQDASWALRWRLRQDGVSEMATGKTRVHAGERGNRLGGVESLHGYHPNRRLSVVSVDGLDDGGESDHGGVLDQVERPSRTDVSRGRNTSSSRSSSLSCSTPGFCADVDVKSGSRGPPVGSCSTVLPHSRYRYPGLSSDRGSVFGSHLRRRVKDRTMGDVLLPGSCSHPRIRYQTSMSGRFKPSIPSFSSTSLEEVSCTYDAHIFQDNTELNTGGNSSWLIHGHEHVHANTQEFDTLRFSSSSSPTPVPAPSNPLLDGKDKPDETMDSEAGGSGPGLIGCPLNGELRSYMKTDMTSDSSTRTDFNGGADGENYIARGRPLTWFINKLGNNDGSVSRHVDGVEHRDMGGLEHESLGPSNHCGHASPISASVPQVSRGFVAGSLFPPALGTRLHSYERDTRIPTSLDSRAASTRSLSIDHGEGEELEECGLLKSLLESSDPWGLMRKKVLNLPSPTPSEVERRSKREQENMAIVRGSLGRRGVGYVTPPSMDALLGVVDLDSEAEMEDVEDGGGSDEGSQEILDFHSSQPCTGHFSVSVGQAE